MVAAYIQSSCSYSLLHRRDCSSSSAPREGSAGAGGWTDWDGLVGAEHETPPVVRELGWPGVPSLGCCRNLTFWWGRGKTSVGCYHFNSPVRWTEVSCIGYVSRVASQGPLLAKWVGIFGAHGKFQSLAWSHGKVTRSSGVACRTLLTRCSWDS